MKKPDNTLALDAYKRLLAQQEEAERKARREKKAKPGHEESTLQRACVAWFRAEYPEHAQMLFAVPNGGGRSRVEAAIMKGEGVTAGVADLIFLEARGGYGALCIELKRRKDINALAREGMMKPDRRVNPGWFKKGVRNNPDGEFQPGHRESPETRDRRIASLKRHIEQRRKDRAARLELDMNLHPEKYYV